MAPLPSPGQRPFNTRRRSTRKSEPTTPSGESPSFTETRSMKRKYVPGGLGGGSSFVSPHGVEVPVAGAGPGGSAVLGSRSRVARESVTNGVEPVKYPRSRRESRRERPPARPRFSSAAAAAAAVVHGDGFKPREERGWEEFHQDLEISAPFPVFSADEVDGIRRATPSPSFEKQNGSQSGDAEDQDRDRESATPGAADTTPRRRPGRPPRRADSMLKGIGTPEVPKVVPLPGFNPREKLTLPKPSFRPMDPFVKYEQRENYVDRGMANVGYQESEIYIRPDKSLVRVTEGNIEEDLDVATGARNEGDSNSALSGIGVGRVEYDMDEQDTHWLEAHNSQRKDEGVEIIKPTIFEITMTKIEKEWHALEKRIPKPNPKPPQTHRPRSSSAAAVNGEPAGLGEEQDSKCAICDDGDCENTNAIVFCDGCDLAVHQECYGVPFIPEGQWLCRKCQLIGRGTPTCIFCPNTDGAFKQTNSSRWAHLLCAIWIPEVSIGNSTFMEPVMDVEKVPKPRWKLTCYICRQKMGACIQCGNKNCYIAFHVTCARRAKLFLKMKSTHGGPASIDASVLKAYCDKHVPADWRREHEVDTATNDAMEYYRYTMRGRLWADSQQSALVMGATYPSEVSMPDPTEEPSNSKITLNFNPNKRKRNETPKVIWRLPSGAPVIPQIVYNSVENSLVRFAIRRRKEFAAEACKYWTLKREARRGAALLKRLQLQMETFTSMEITRRNFVGMGAAGGVRLQRRLDFAAQLLQDVEKLKQMCTVVKARELEKLEDVKLLKGIIDTVYFPIVPILWPILEKAQSLDGKRVFRQGFSKIKAKLSSRQYTSIAGFSEDFGAVINAALGPSPIGEFNEHGQIDGESSGKDLISELKYKKQLANRIIKAVKGPLEESMRKESELCQKPFEKELQALDRLLEKSVLSRRVSLTASQPVDGDVIETVNLHVNGENMRHKEDNHISNMEIDLSTNHTYPQDLEVRDGSHDTVDKPLTPYPNQRQQPTPDSTISINGNNGYESKSNGDSRAVGSYRLGNGVEEPPTPPLSSGGHSHPLADGGIPWYMDTFDPVGTTIAEERWTGREAGMDEELSEMDEEELSGLIDIDDLPAGTGLIKDAQDQAAPEEAQKKIKAKSAKRKRWRGYG